MNQNNGNVNDRAADCKTTVNQDIKASIATGTLEQMPFILITINYSKGAIYLKSIQLMIKIPIFHAVFNLNGCISLRICNVLHVRFQFYILYVQLSYSIKIVEILLENDKSYCHNKGTIDIPLPFI